MPVRLYHCKSAGRPFTCRICDLTIAYEDQCVYSIVANNIVYIKEQFVLHHCRRDFISSEYDTREDHCKKKY